MLRIERGLIRIPAGVDVVGFIRPDGCVPETTETIVASATARRAGMQPAPGRAT